MLSFTIRAQEGRLLLWSAEPDAGSSGPFLQHGQSGREDGDCVSAGKSVRSQIKSADDFILSMKRR